MGKRIKDRNEWKSTNMLNQHYKHKVCIFHSYNLFFVYNLIAELCSESKGRHTEPHTYRTHALIFIWSHLSAANGLRAHMGNEVSQDGTHTY